MKPILNSKGEPIVLNERQQLQADFWTGQIKNTLGAELNITTLTQMVAQVTEQKFFTLPPGDFMPVNVGEGAYMQNLETWKAYRLGGAFEDGDVDQGKDNARRASVDAAVEGVQIPIRNWAKSVEYNVFQLAQASKTGNWDLVSQLERARKENWDLGIQKIAFIGHATDNRFKGLLTQTAVAAASNTTVITKSISSMTDTEYNTFLTKLVEAYRARVNRTAWPDTFAIPESDYNGLNSFPSATFPLKTKLELLEEALKKSCQNPNFKVMCCAYGDTTTSGLPVQRYALYRRNDPTSLILHLPLDFTPTAANTLNGFTFENVGMGQYCGVLALRELEMLYFDYTPS